MEVVNRVEGPRRQTLLLVRQLAASFISSDIEILRRHFKVVDYHYRSHPHPARHLISWMFRNRRMFDVVLVWFGDVHATVAASVALILRKPCILVVGGYDASAMPGHGFLSTRKGALLASIHFALSKRILAVSEALRNELIAYWPKLRAKVRVLPTGCDADFWRPGGAKGENILSVALAEHWHRAYVKGLDRVVECARRLPNHRFEIVGVFPEVQSRFGPLPQNCALTAPMPPEGLRSRYQAASVYLQLSRSEGLGMVVAEAMACGCVPVVARIGGLPELVGDAGYVVDPENPAEVAAAIEKALDNHELRARARERIALRFSTRNREEGLVREIASLLTKASPRGG